VHFCDQCRNFAVCHPVSRTSRERAEGSEPKQGDIMELGASERLMGDMAACLWHFKLYIAPHHHYYFIIAGKHYL
jgi:hypothetical protein